MTDIKQLQNLHKEICEESNYLSEIICKYTPEIPTMSDIELVFFNGII